MTENGKAQGRMRNAAAIWIVLCAFALAGSLAAKNGAFKSTGHGNPDKGPHRREDQPRGSCIQCHDQHGSHDSTRSTSGNKAALFAADDNELCFSCHRVQSDSGIYLGVGPWSRSGHGQSPQLLRNARPSEDTGKCINCHDPHGVKDNAGVIPAMLSDREPALCLECHDGSRGADIRNEMLKLYQHAQNAFGTHNPLEGADPARYGSTPGNNRHATCSDCHNVHQSTGRRNSASAPDAPASLTGVSRVEVTNGPAGTIPVYRYRTAGDPGQAREYEICFKCHSTWTKQPPGQADLARLTNPANPSYHPIQDIGRNRGIDPAAFAGGVDERTILYCTDCHTSDASNVRGPHGSTFPYVLKKQAITTTDAQATPPQNLCFDCHAWTVYGDANAAETTQRASRFNGPATKGHVYHVAVQQIPCFTCHETHGSYRYPSLITTGRLPGITSYLQSPLGGTCTPTCHEARSWSVNYPR